ncbi:hypothetical protein DPEC_G00036560 [Dallia pectoralis]|uniref:Uncharacterized protein n=1 Tax=Dallia pectoralis TaxID=75939 RepID=A0ACC2HEB1_DALPE|nr:hypothetical protein DPEC_G00036560 [Dallia pectoralis]
MTAGPQVSAGAKETGKKEKEGVKVIKSSSSLGNGKERNRQACGSGLIPQGEAKDGPAEWHFSQNSLLLLNL